MTSALSFDGPIAIGGVGGSGTRVVAQILADCGYDIGQQLSMALDDLWFTFLFKRPEILSVHDQQMHRVWSLYVDTRRRPRELESPEIALIQDLCRKRAGHSSEWLERVAETLRHRMQSGCSTEQKPWVWKEPNTHLVIQRLFKLSPDLRYVHVIRNGLDMAFSKNQNQLKMWGAVVLGEQVQHNPRWSLKFWCETHRRLLNLRSHYPERIHLLSFDRLTSNPVASISKLLQYVGCQVHEGLLEKLASGVHKPTTSGRFRSQDTSQLRAEDIQFVRDLGFP